jgi:hypothetical protein
MAAYKALVSFTGQVAMFKGQVKELTDHAAIADLLRAGYIEPMEQPEQVEVPEQVEQPEQEVKKPVRRTTKKASTK